MRYLILILSIAQLAWANEPSIFLKGQLYNAPLFEKEFKKEEVQKWLTLLKDFKYNKKDDTNWEELKKKKLGAVLKSHQVRLVGDYRLPCEIIKSSHENVKLLSEQIDMIREQSMQLMKRFISYPSESVKRQLREKIDSLNSLLKVAKSQYHESFFNYDREITYFYDFYTSDGERLVVDYDRQVPLKITKVHSFKFSNLQNNNFENVLEHIYGFSQSSAKVDDTFQFKLVRKMRAIDYCLGDSSVKMQATIQFTKKKYISFSSSCIISEPLCPNGSVARNGNCLFYHRPIIHPHVPSIGGFEPEPWPWGPDEDPPKPHYLRSGANGRMKSGGVRLYNEPLPALKLCEQTISEMETWEQKVEF